MHLHTNAMLCIARVKPLDNPTNTHSRCQRPRSSQFPVSVVCMYCICRMCVVNTHSPTHTRSLSLNAKVWSVDDAAWTCRINEGLAGMVRFYFPAPWMGLVYFKHPNQMPHPLCLNDMRCGSIPPFDMSCLSSKISPPKSVSRFPILREANAPSCSFALLSFLVSSSHCLFLLPLLLHG